MPNATVVIIVAAMGLLAVAAVAKRQASLSTPGAWLMAAAISVISAAIVFWFNRNEWSTTWTFLLACYVAALLGFGIEALRTGSR